jgi:hypothetical protein
MDYGFDIFDVFTKTAANSTCQLIDINTRIYKRLIKRQIELIN